MYLYRAIGWTFVDGDTIKFTLDLGFSITHKVRVRLMDLNTPELRSKDLAVKAMAQAATKFVEDWMADKSCVVVRTIKKIDTSDKYDKYGRYLAYVYSEDLKQCLNDDIKEAGFSV